MADTLNSVQSTKSAIKPSRRRDKPQLSCTLCRRRKLKCDRRQPCETCVRRGLSLSCTYVPFHSKEPERHDQRQVGPAGTSAIQDRIGQLETLVTSLMNNLQRSNPPRAISGEKHDSPNPSSAVAAPELVYNFNQEPSPLADSVGRISLDSTETVYVESAHWTAILDGIAELKDSFEGDTESTEDNTIPSNVECRYSPDLVFGSYEHVDKHQILAAIPPRLIVDRLMAEYFNSMHIAPGSLSFLYSMVLRSTDLTKYDAFWDHPLDTPVIWIGLLLAVLCLATLHHRQSDYPQFDSDSPDVVQIYREKIIQCLVLGRYTKCPPYTLETLLLYLHIEVIKSDDAQIENWIIVGVIVRLALRMGYHRDPSHFPSISPFHAEMRRRTWAYIFQLDVLASAQFGLPRMIKQSQSDTAEPRNLKDEDLDENMQELPLPRPESDQTSVQYAVEKNKIASVYGMICDLTTSTPPPSYAEVLRLDSILNEAYSAMPQALQMRPMEKSIIDSPNVIINRLYISLLFQKSKCVLHRKYMLGARTDSRYYYSRVTCVNAALQCLQYQSLLHDETQAGGRLYNDRWKVSSIINGDFLMATSVLCLDISHDISAESLSEYQTTSVDSDLKHRVTNALEKSYPIWLQLSHSSREGQKAVEVLRVVLDKIKKASTAMDTGSTTLDGQDNSSTDLSPSIPGILRTQLASETIHHISNTHILPEDSGTWTDSLDTEAEFFDLYNLGFPYKTQTVDEMLEMTLG
ncbi:fungal-specific transcription factor domain-containing protein [Lipomyces kononenkoae]|uniref:Fungal-specific transcription factor domain-containing protein n=1 Tax=Lipomyces kononenkoae TaxID=34357 RepID=A0ACC3SQ87_LIPKO